MFHSFGSRPPRRDEWSSILCPTSCAKAAIFRSSESVFQNPGFTHRVRPSVASVGTASSSTTDIE